MAVAKMQCGVCFFMAGCSSLTRLRNEDFDSEKISRRLVERIGPLDGGTVARDGVVRRPCTMQIPGSPNPVASARDSWNAKDKVSPGSVRCGAEGGCGGNRIRPREILHKVCGSIPVGVCARAKSQVPEILILPGIRQPIAVGVRRLIKRRRVWVKDFNQSRRRTVRCVSGTNRGMVLPCTKHRLTSARINLCTQRKRKNQTNQNSRRSGHGAYPTARPFFLKDFYPLPKSIQVSCSSEKTARNDHLRGAQKTP